MRVSIEEDRTFDHDESDYLLSPPSEASGVRFKKKKTAKFSMERYVIWISSCTICIILRTRPMLLSRFCANLYQCCRRQKELKSRTVWIGLSQEQQREKSDDYFPPNGIRNQKYNFFSFLPLVSTSFVSIINLIEFKIEILIFLLQVLFQQFKFFLNLYFLIMAVSQFIPEIRIGYLYTYWGPLVIFDFNRTYLCFHFLIRPYSTLVVCVVCNNGQRSYRRFSQSAAWQGNQ